jgi:hypothetical protein
MPTLRPFRDYDEHDVINLFSWSGAVPAYKGTMVKMLAGGFKADAADPVEMFGAAGAAVQNTVSQRYRTSAQITTCGTGAAGTRDIPLGMLLYDVRENDENGEKLLYHPRKAAENDWVISGQAAPVLTRGIVLYSGATITASTPTLGATLYHAANGELGDAGDVGTHGSGLGASAVGKCLGTLDGNNHILVKLEL